MQLVELGNKFYDEKEPWIAKKENIEEFNNIIYTCTVIIANLSNLFEMVMPTACKKIREYLKIENSRMESSFALHFRQNKRLFFVKRLQKMSGIGSNFVLYCFLA